jgi:hypothetical protein
MISDDTMVVTSSYVTENSMPILLVTHENDDEDGSSLWQFHCGNGDYHMSKMQLVRLDTLLYLDSSIRKVLDLPKGMMARRDTKVSEWVYQPI